MLKREETPKCIHIRISRFEVDDDDLRLFIVSQEGQFEAYKKNFQVPHKKPVPLFVRLSTLVLKAARTK